MVVASREELQRVTAELRALWLRRRRRRRAELLLLAIALAAAAGVAVWPRGGRAPVGAPLASQSAAPIRRMPVRPAPVRPASVRPDALRGLLAALPASEGVMHGSTAQN